MCDEAAISLPFIGIITAIVKRITGPIFFNAFAVKTLELFTRTSRFTVLLVTIVDTVLF